MAREAFKEKRWRYADLKIVEHVTAALDAFAEEDVHQVTLRTVYYALVKENIIPNDNAWYKKLGDIVSDARMCGLLDWEAIIDQTRRSLMVMPSEWSGPADLMEGALFGYRLPRWEGQKNYVEVWVEKEGMGVQVATVTEKWHVRLCPNKGYGSTTALYEGSKRFLEAADKGLNLHLLYLGDHDPSGLDMDRDIEERLSVFGVRDIDVERIALTTEQVRRYDPPPNPAKLTDKRAAAYIARHGRTSWEVNALSPGTINKMIEARLKRLVNKPIMDAIIEREEKHKRELRRLTAEVEDDE